MSYSATYYVYKTTATRIKEYRNSHGTMSILWNMLYVKYMGGKPHYYNLNEGDTEKLWELWKDPKVPEHLRICHLFTFDDAVCKFDDLPRLADACEEAYVDLVKFDANTVNHWKDLGNDLRGIRPKARSWGVGLTCTSVSDPWSDYAFLRGKRHESLWGIFRQLDGK